MHISIDTTSNFLHEIKKIKILEYRHLFLIFLEDYE